MTFLSALEVFIVQNFCSIAYTFQNQCTQLRFPVHNRPLITDHVNNRPIMRDHVCRLETMCAERNTTTSRIPPIWTNFSATRLIGIPKLRYKGLCTIKSSRFVASFRGISRLGSAFIFL